MMKTVKSLAIVFCAGLFLFASSVKADQLDKKTIFTFSAPVRVADTTLPAGTYTFKLMNLGYSSDKSVVEIYNEDETQLITTVMAMPDWRLEPTGHTVVKFAETNDETQASGNVPESGIPLKEWFYPGDNYGEEFPVKPVEVAAVQPEPTPAPAPEPQVETPAPAPETAGPPVEEPPAQEAAPAPTPQTQETSPAPEQPSAPTELPQTASQMPLVGLIGIISLVAAASLRIIAKKSA
jgi:outer membrane biosynthesis protein TonB